MKAIRFPDIEQYRHVIKKVRDRHQFMGLSEHETGNSVPVFDRTIELPVLTFRGTVKLHGTNAGVVLYPDGKQVPQSRNNCVGGDNTHFGFTQLVNDFSFFKCIKLRSEHPITLYGEWCGEGIQKGVAISQLKKMFVIFAIRIGTDENTKWLNPETFHDVFVNVNKMNKMGVYHSNQFKTYEMKIDFNRPELVQNDLGDITHEVEAQCPVGDHFSVAGIGEGVVWKCVDEGFEGSDFWFKVKGEKHSPTKVKKLAEVDIEKIKSIDLFLDNVITEARLLQSIDNLIEQQKPIDHTSTGDFIRWVFNDVIKEESDVMEASGLDKKEIGKQLGTRAKTWYFRYLDELAIR